MNVYDLFGEDASGVVANKRQARDPRYSMSLSPDVRPGEITRQLKKYNLVEGEENLARLDAILVDLCAGIIRHQKQDNNRYGLVAAAVVDPDHNVVYGINNLQSTGKRVHAERAALANYKQKHGDIPEGSVIVTTLSPCTEPMQDREGMSCSELIDTTPIRRVYAGYRDPSQDHLTHDDFDVVVTNNSKLEQLCKGFADCFLKEDGAQGGKLVIFDIDDTLVNTNTKVIVRRDGRPVRQLTSQEFTHYKLQPGETFDFGAFSDAEEFARESRPIVPMIQQLNADIASGNKVVMITARSDFDDRDTFLNAFRQWSVDIDRVHVYRAGNDRRPVSVDAKKADIVRRLLGSGNYSKAIMYDDSKPNLQSFVRLHREYPSTRFYAWHVDHGGHTTEYARTGIRQPDAMFEADTAGEITDAVIDFYKKQDIKPEKVNDYVEHAVDLLHRADPTIRGRVREILSRANKNPYIQGGVITTVGALLTGGLLTTASQMHLTPAQTNILLQAVLNTVIPTVVSRVNGKNWIDTVKYTLASAGIGTGIALLSEDTESDIDSIAQEFVEFVSKRLQFDQMPHIDFVEHVTGTEHPTFGSYDSNTDVINIGTSDRHVMDIMRTLAHELVHHKQRETKSELDGGTASRDENQANSVAGTLMREFADQHPEYFGGKPGVAEGKEQFNYELAQKGFHFEQEIGGVTYRVTNKKGGSDNINIEAIDDKGQAIGFARFWMHQYKNGLESLSTQVRDDWQGKGIAANMYAVMRMLGVNIHPASMQSDDGKKMWDKWNKQGDARHIKSMNAKMAENFADGKNPGRKGLAKRSGVNTKASVSTLRNVAKHSSGEKQRMAHWLANMKAGRAKARKK